MTISNQKIKILLKKGVVLIVLYSIVLIFLSIVSCNETDSKELPEIINSDTTFAIENTTKFKISKDSIIGNIYDTIDFTINVNKKSVVDTNITYLIVETNKEYKAGKVPVNKLVLGNQYTIKIIRTNITYKFKVYDKNNIIKCRKYLWIDATANFARFSNKDSILYYVNKVKDVGFTDLVVDMKPCSGDVLYTSKYLYQLKTWAGYTRNINFDYLETFINEGHRLGLKVNANLNTFSFGNKYYQAGLFYKGHYLEWMTINNTWRGLINGRDDTEETVEVFANPALPEVQALALNIIKEIATKYPTLDGVVLDRARYNGLTSDFSQKSKELFEAYAGVKVQNFPADIYTPAQNSKDRTIIGTVGQHLPKWLEWRASIIYSFFENARNTVKSVNPNMKFGTYTGAWYWEYYGLGVNWASKRYDPKTDGSIGNNSYYTNNYKNFGYAALLDIYMTGAYSGYLNSGENWGWNVADLCKIAKRITMGDCPVSGGLNVPDHTTNDNLRKAVEVAISETDGLMIFDICHVIKDNRWDAIKQGIANSKK